MYLQQRVRDRLASEIFDSLMFIHFATNYKLNTYIYLMMRHFCAALLQKMTSRMSRIHYFIHT